LKERLEDFRVVGLAYEGDLFEFIFGSFLEDFNSCDLKNRFEIPGRGKELKKVDICYNEKGLIGFRLYGKGLKIIFEWDCVKGNAMNVTTIKDGMQIIDFLSYMNEQKTSIVYADFGLAQFDN
jgi:hypothetical protein